MKQKIARVVSDILFNPGVLAIIILIVAVLKSSMPETIMYCWLIAVIVLNGVIPGLFYLFFTSRGYVFDTREQNIKIRKERIIIFSVFLALVTLELLILVSTRIYQPLLAVFTGGIITLVVGSIITYFWKISVHSAMITFFVAMLVIIFGWQVWYAVVLIPIVWWSRLVLNRHTLLQLLFGFFLSLAIIVSTFYMYSLIEL